jgi:hypothetical protein
LRRFCRNRRGSRIAHPNRIADAGRIFFSLDFTGTIYAVLAHPGANAFPAACAKRPDQFRSPANGRHDQPWDL